jgi:hypothetical protein
MLTYRQGVVDLTLLTVVAVSKDRAALLQSAVAPVLTRMLESITDDALHNVSIKLE